MRPIQLFPQCPLELGFDGAIDLLKDAANEAKDFAACFSRRGVAVFDVANFVS